MATFKENFPLTPFTYFKIGGPTRYFVEVASESELRDAVKEAKGRSLPFIIVGAASNMLVSDRGYPGVAIRMLLRGMNIDGSSITVEAGVPNAVVVARSVQEQLAGFEWAIGIPGTIGGSVRGNAGCFSGEMKDVVDHVDVFDTETGETQEFSNARCEFGYRESVFKKSPNLIVVRVHLALRKGNPETGGRLVRYYTSTRTDAQDIGSSSAGCVFKNVAWPEDEKARNRILRVFPQLADFSAQAVIPAGFLIDHLGLKGITIGNVSISQKHANYLINRGGASAEEVIMMIGLIKERVHRTYGLHLQEEIQYVGFDHA